MKYGLVLEGGSRKGMFSAGVLDVLIEENIKFQYVNGVSAGSHAAMNFVSGQKGRLKEVLKPSALRKNKKAHKLLDGIYSEFKIMNYEMAYDENLPFDFKKYFESDIECEFGLTCAETGKQTFFSEKTEEGLLKTAAASCSLPMLFPLIEINGFHYGDGCITDSVPYDRAFERGCDKVVVISTKKVGKEPTDFSKLKFMLSPMYQRKYPKLYKAMIDRAPTYFRQLEIMEKYEAKGKILVVRPDIMCCSAFETDPEKIENAYNHGLEVGRRELESIKAFLA